MAHGTVERKAFEHGADLARRGLQAGTPVLIVFCLSPLLAKPHLRA